MKPLIFATAILCTGCAEPVIRAGNQCGVILNNGVSAWVPCATNSGSSIGRAAVSKTAGSGFKSSPVCHWLRDA